jgi:hypothetical protein
VATETTAKATLGQRAVHEFKELAILTATRSLSTDILGIPGPWVRSSSSSRSRRIGRPLQDLHRRVGQIEPLLQQIDAQ